MLPINEEIYVLVSKDFCRFTIFHWVVPSWLPLGLLLPSSVYLGEASNNLHIHGAIDLEENGRLSTTAEMYRPATKDRQRQMEDEFKKNESINTKTSTENNERHDLIWCDMNGGDKSTCQVSLMFPSCLPHIVYNSTIMWGDHMIYDLAELFFVLPKTFFSLHFFLHFFSFRNFSLYSTPLTTALETITIDNNHDKQNKYFRWYSSLDNAWRLLNGSWI